MEILSDLVWLTLYQRGHVQELGILLSGLVAPTA